MKNIIVILLTLIGFIFPQDCDCEEPINVWFKISNAEKDYGQLLTLDMSNGFATTDGLFIYIIVKNMDTGEDLVIQFPIGYWIIDKIDKLNADVICLQEVFDKGIRKTIIDYFKNKYK